MLQRRLPKSNVGLLKLVLVTMQSLLLDCGLFSRRSMSHYSRLVLLIVWAFHVQFGMEALLCRVQSSRLVG